SLSLEPGTHADRLKRLTLSAGDVLKRLNGPGRGNGSPVVSLPADMDLCVKNTAHQLSPSFFLSEGEAFGFAQLTVSRSSFAAWRSETSTESPRLSSIWTPSRMVSIFA